MRKRSYNWEYKLHDTILYIHLLVKHTIFFHSCCRRETYFVDNFICHIFLLGGVGRMRLSYWIFPYYLQQGCITLKSCHLSNYCLFSPLQLRSLVLVGNTWTIYCVTLRSNHSYYFWSSTKDCNVALFDFFDIINN